MVTARGGYLVVTFLLPLTTEYWALMLVQGGGVATTAGPGLHVFWLCAEFFGSQDTAAGARRLGKSVARG